jgi:threonine dehydrogenase-like Zn-dependent dehydrogenase
MKTVVIVGVGALGSHLVQFLRNEAVTLKVIDFDRIERKNVMSQFHGKATVGKNKVQGLAQAMNFLFGVKIDTVPHKLTDDNAETLLRADLVIDCLDNGEARRTIQRVVRANGTPCLHGALSAADNAFGRVVWDPDFTIDDEGQEGAATCENGAALPFIALVSAVMAKAAQEFLADGTCHSYQAHAGGVVRI